MSDQSTLYPNLSWDLFAIFNDNVTVSFEDMCRDLFYCEYLHENRNPHSDHNNPGVEVLPILEPKRDDGEPQKLISFQAKYFKRSINNSQIKESLKQAIKYYKGQLGRIYLFCNIVISKDSEHFRQYQAVLMSANIELELVTDRDIFALLRKHKRVADYYFQDRKRATMGASDFMKSAAIVSSASEESLKKVLDESKSAIGDDSIGNTYGIGYYLKNNVKEVDSITLRSYSDLKSHLYNIIFPGRPLLRNRFDADTTQIDEYVETPSVQEQLVRVSLKNNIVILCGAPGSGKSTFLSALRNKINIAGFFACKWDDSEKNDISSLLKDLCVQFMEFSEEYCQELYFILESMDPYNFLSKSESKLFELLILQPFEKLKQVKTYYIVIDGIDELLKPASFIKVLDKASRKLPPSIRFILSARDSVMSYYNLHNAVTINLNKESNHESIKRYLGQRLTYVSQSKLLDSLLEKCNGSFLYAKCLCDYYDTHSLNSDLQGLIPDNLDSIYYDYFERIFIDKEEYTKQYRKVFSIILASAHNLTIKEIQRIVGWDEVSTITFFRRISDLLDINLYPDKIAFFHKSLGDWLQSFSSAKDFYASKQEGNDLIFEYIRRCYLTDECETLSYGILKKWRMYGARYSQRGQYKVLLNNIDFILYTINEYRNHSDYDLAIEETNLMIRMSESADALRLRALTSMNDILIDLEDPQAGREINRLLAEAPLISKTDSYLAIHVFENAGWISMQAGNYKESEAFYKQALQYYSNIAFGSKKRNGYAHTLYLYSIVLYRMRNLKECKHYLTLSQEIIKGEEGEERSLSYSLGLKMLAWVETANQRRKTAEELFFEALTVQKRLFDIPNIYIAHTLMCLAENELYLYHETNDEKYANMALQHVAEAKDIYHRFDIRFENNIKRLSNIEDKVKKNGKNM